MLQWFEKKTKKQKAQLLPDSEIVKSDDVGQVEQVVANLFVAQGPRRSLHSEAARQINF